MAIEKHNEILKSVRDFLISESETFGSFQFPDASPEQDSYSGEASFIDQKAASVPASVSPDKPADHSRSATSANSPAEKLSAALENSSTLEELRTICINADELKTDLSNTNLVFGTGNPEADIMLIGEAPGAQEDKEGEPFVGKAGQLLNKILNAISFMREEVYIANILKHRPPNNRDPLPEERDRSLPYLYRQIELVKPKWIVCLGRISAQTLLNTNKPMKSLRGTFHPFRNDIELMVTYHPAALLRNPSWKKDTWEDVQMLRKRYDETKKSGK